MEIKMRGKGINRNNMPLGPFSNTANPHFIPLSSLPGWMAESHFNPLSPMSSQAPFLHKGYQHLADPFHMRHMTILDQSSLSHTTSDASSQSFLQQLLSSKAWPFKLFLECKKPWITFSEVPLCREVWTEGYLVVISSGSSNHVECFYFLYEQ